MPDNIYPVVAGILGYVYAALGCIIVLRAFFMLRRDHRETRRILRRLPDAGNVGELTVIQGTENCPEGMVFSVPREGILGSVRSCDLTVYGSGIRKKHLDFSFEDGLGLLIMPRSGCSALVDGTEFTCRTPSTKHPMTHGSFLQIGDVIFRLRLFAGVDIKRNARFADESADSVLNPIMTPRRTHEERNVPCHSETDQNQHIRSYDFPVPLSGNFSADTAPRRVRRGDRWEDDPDE